jgi:hypothetical protein
MTKLNDYMKDGANHQAKAVMAFIQPFEIEKSWNSDRGRYDAEHKISRWENCREQGYVIMLNCYAKGGSKQLNIAFFEHRNSDSICAVKWEQVTMNSPTIETAEFGDVYKDKYDVSHSVGYGKILEMAEWIEEQMTNFWVENTQTEK